MTGYDLNFAKELYRETVAVKDSEYYGYYGNSLRLLTLLYITGNFPNPLSDLSGQPTPPSNPTPSLPPQVVYVM